MPDVPLLLEVPVSTAVVLVGAVAGWVGVVLIGKLLWRGLRAVWGCP
jgi:phosphate/sulfate permease